jgi:ATP-dependent Clp protease, protease subunit
MIHRAMGGAMGYADDLRKLAEVLDSVTDSAADIYVSRTAMKKNEVLSLMNAETWMSAADAVKAGFANAVFSGSVKNVAGPFDLSIFKNTPPQLKTENVIEPTIEADPLINIYRKRLELLKG